MPYRRTPATQARLDAQRATVLDAALALLAEDGYAGCTVTAVAARAGIATGTVYRHFAGKSELAVELFRTAVGREVAAVTAAADRRAGPAADVVAVIQTFAGRALKSPRLAYALLAEPVDPAVDAERLVFRRAFRDIFAERIAEGVAAGELPPQDPQSTAAALVGAGAEALVGPLCAETAQRGGHPDPIAELTAFTLRALGATDASVAARSADPGPVLAAPDLGHP